MTRSIVVVLLVDTVNSTTILSQLGQTRMDELSALEMEALRDAAVANDGEVLRSLGDGLLATFSAASSALDAAAAMHRNIARLNEGSPFGVDVRVRVTLAASDVVMEDGEIRGVPPARSAWRPPRPAGPPRWGGRGTKPARAPARRSAPTRCGHSPRAGVTIGSSGSRRSCCAASRNRCRSTG